jgi:hypothetical protein
MAQAIIGGFMDGVTGCAIILLMGCVVYAITEIRSARKDTKNYEEGETD